MPACHRVSASAAWNNGSFADRMTDKKFSYAELPSKDGKAKALRCCMSGNIMPDVQFFERGGYGQMGVSYRFDEGSVVPRIVELRSRR